MGALLLAPAVAVAFLTRLPLPLPARPPAAAFPRAVGFFPLVGALLGVAIAAADALLLTVVAAPVASAIDLVLLALLTGGLHLDGLADAADGVLGRLERERRLAVMREGQVGPFGVAAVALVLVLEQSALAQLAGPARPLAIVAACVLARWAMSLALWRFPYARPAGLGRAFKDGLGLRDLALASAIAAAVVVAAVPDRAIAAVALVAALVLTLGAFAARRLGGLTGDTYGALGELAFAVALVALGRGS